MNKKIFNWKKFLFEAIYGKRVKEEEEQPEAIPVVNEAEVTQSEETASPGFENENAIGEKGLESAQQQQEETVVEENNEKKAEEIQQQEQEGENVVVAPVESQ